MNRETEIMQCTHRERGKRCTAMIEVLKGAFHYPMCLDHSQFRTHPDWKQFYQPEIKRVSGLSNSR